MTDGGADGPDDPDGPDADRRALDIEDGDGFVAVDREPPLAFWEEEFGVPPAVFEGFDVYALGASKVWIVDAAVPVDGPPERETVGLPFLRVNQEHWKPTTAALQRFGDQVSRNVVDLDADQARRFVAGDTVEATYPELPSLGYVAARYDGEVLGCGLYFPGELRSQIPKGRQVDLVLPD